MATPIDHLTLAQWFSPSFPVGAFAYSHGLEAAIDGGQVTRVDEASAFVKDALELGAGWNDALLLVSAYHAETAEDVQSIDATARALSASRERLMETDLQGSAFCKAIAEVWAQDLTGLCYPVAVGRAAYLAGFDPTLTTEMYLHAFVSNLAAAAMRLVPLGQVDGQRIIRDLTPLCAEISARAQTGSLDDLSSTAFLTDIAAMAHETQYSRIFRT